MAGAGTVAELAARWLDAQRRLVAFGDKKAAETGAELDAIANAAGPLLGQWLRTHSLYLTRFVGADTIMGILKSSPPVPVDEKLIALERDISIEMKRQEELDTDIAKLLGSRNPTRRLQRQLDQKTAQVEVVRSRLNEMAKLHREVLIRQAKPFSVFCDYLRTKVMLNDRDSLFIWVALNSNDLLVFKCTNDDLKDHSEVIAKLVDGGRRIVAIVLQSNTVVPGNTMYAARFYTIFPLPKSVLLFVSAQPSNLIGQQIWKVPNENIDPDWWATLTFLSQTDEDGDELSLLCWTYGPGDVRNQIAVFVPATDERKLRLPDAARDVTAFKEWTIITKGVVDINPIPISQWIPTLQNRKHLLVQRGYSEYSLKNAYVYPLIVTDERRIGSLEQFEKQLQPVESKSTIPYFRQVWTFALSLAIDLAGIRLGMVSSARIPILTHFLWIFVPTGPKTAPEAMPLFISEGVDDPPAFRITQPIWSGESTYPCLEVTVHNVDADATQVSEADAKYLELFRPIIDKNVVPYAANTPRTAISAHVDYISGDGGCSKMVLTEGVSIGAVLVNLAKSIGSLYDVDLMDLSDASKVSCGNNPWLLPAKVSLKWINTMKENAPWYSRWGFVPSNRQAEGIRFVREILAKRPWSAVRDALIKVAKVDLEAEVANRLILDVYALDAANCCLPSPDCKDARCKAEQPATKVLVGASQGNLCSLIGTVLTILDTPKNIELFLTFLGVGSGSFDAYGIQRFFSEMTDLTWFRRPPKIVRLSQQQPSSDIEIRSGGFKVHHTKGPTRNKVE